MFLFTYIRYETVKMVTSANQNVARTCTETIERIDSFRYYDNPSLINTAIINSTTEVNVIPLIERIRMKRLFVFSPHVVCCFENISGRNDHFVNTQKSTAVLQVSNTRVHACKPYTDFGYNKITSYVV